MVSPQLLKYFSDGITKGQQIEAIRAQLIQQGWPLNEVDQAVLEIKPNKSIVSDEKKRPTAITFFGSFGMLLSGGLIFFGVYSLIGGFVSTSGATSLLNNLSSFVPFLFLITTPRMTPIQIFLAGLYLIVIGVVGFIANLQLFLLKRLGFWLFMISQVFVLGGTIVSGNFLSIHGLFIPLILGIYVLASKNLFT